MAVGPEDEGHAIEMVSSNAGAWLHHRIPKWPKKMVMVIHCPGSQLRFGPVAMAATSVPDCWTTFGALECRTLGKSIQSCLGGISLSTQWSWRASEPTSLLSPVVAPSSHQGWLDLLEVCTRAYRRPNYIQCHTSLPLFTHLFYINIVMHYRQDIKAHTRQQARYNR